MFGRHKRSALPFDKSGKTPVIRASICTGERTAGFRDQASGKFTEIMLIRNDADLQEFLQTYGIKETDLKREW